MKYQIEVKNYKTNEWRRYKSFNTKFVVWLNDLKERIIQTFVYG